MGGGGSARHTMGPMGLRLFFSHTRLVKTDLGRASKMTGKGSKTGRG